MVDLVGIEPTTSSMPWKRAPSCATGPHLDCLSIVTEQRRNRQWTAAAAVGAEMRAGLPKTAICRELFANNYVFHGGAGRILSNGPLHVKAQYPSQKDIPERADADRAGDSAHAQAAVISYAAGSDFVRLHADRGSVHDRGNEPLHLGKSGKFWRERLPGEPFPADHQL